MKVADLKTAQEVRAHATKVQCRINAQRHVVQPEPKKEPEKPVNLVQPEGPVPHPIVRIVSLTSEHFRIKPDELTGTRRTGPMIMPRYICYFIARRFGFSWITIAKHCNRDHTSILHGASIIYGRIATKDEKIIAAINVIGLKVARTVFHTDWVLVKI